MRMYQDERRLDFHALGREIKRKREAKGWTQEYLAQWNCQEMCSRGIPKIMDRQESGGVMRELL